MFSRRKHFEQEISCCGHIDYHPSFFISRNTTPLVLVGNKGDLEIVRKVSRLEGLELAEQLRCEFFEASAREGWSKLLSNGSYSPPWSVSTSDGDTTSNAPTPRASPRNSPCHTSNFAKKSALMYNNGKDNISKSEKSSFSRWGSLKTSKQLKRYGRSFSMTCPPPIISFADAPEPEGSSTIPRMNSFPISPASSRENLNDDIKESQLLFPRRTRLSVPSNPGILGRISPRLGRRFSRSSKKENKNSRDDNNNNNSERKNQELTLSLSLNCLENETEYEISEQKLELVSDCGPCCSSNYGSTESLASAGLEPDNRFPDSSIFSLPSPKRFNTSQVQEQDFSSSEPFLLLCRIGSLSRARSRSRSPSHRIINGLKKIRSLASDLNSQVPSPTKQTNGSLLAPPYNL